MAAAGQIQEERFGPIGGGMGCQHMAACQYLRLLQQAFVAPLPGCRLRGWRRVCPLTMEGQLLAFCPGLEGLGLGPGFRMPAMVSVPEAEMPAMERLQVPQQPEEGHGVLPPGEGQEQAAALGQKGGLAQ